MAARLTCTSDSVPDELLGLVELVRLLARQAARDSVAASTNKSSPINITNIKQPKETSS